MFVCFLLGMINKLELDERGDDMSFMSSVAKSLFSDGTTNWGRIASLVAFGTVVCMCLKKKNREQCVSLVGHEISTYLLNDQREWLIKNNSWVSHKTVLCIMVPSKRRGVLHNQSVVQQHACSVLFKI